jgi:hypothetical protein
MRIVTSSNPPMDELSHHGVKGMHWGVRKDEPTVGRFRGSGPEIDPALHESSKMAASRVASLIGDRYDFNIRKVIGMGPGHPEYEAGTLGLVNITGEQKREGDILISIKDTRPVMKKSEKKKWVGEGCGTPEALLTHEAAHAIFHAPQYHKKDGTIAGGNFDVRMKAIQAAIEQSKKDGIRESKFMSSISGYAARAGNREEAEAELFSQYHWGTNPPNFVMVWGKTLHEGLGIDGTPFRERS